MRRVDRYSVYVYEPALFSVLLLTTGFGVYFALSCVWFTASLVSPWRMKEYILYFRPFPNYAGIIWKWCYHSANVWSAFRPHYPEKLKNATITDHCGFPLDFGLKILTWSGKPHVPLCKILSIHMKTQTRRFKFLRFEEKLLLVTD